ncbi:MAG TPA: hypothetical protein VM075_07020 [Anaerolineae bacterium]|nr:hypothetical protein [Anaerolineae bacterium]
MTGREALRVLGSPEVRNAILLNEIGVLIHELGKLSTEFVSAGSAFPHHLILRRLTRGMDPSLGSEIRPLSALLYALRNYSLTDQERAVASLLGEKTDTLTGDDRAWVDAASRRLEAVLGDLRSVGAPDRLEAEERVGCLARGVLADWEWQIQGERGLEGMEPPFISTEGFHEGLDQLPFVADLVEMQGRTWHPEGLLSPEVRLFRAIHEREEVRGTPRSRCNVEHLAAVRELCCEVLANQLLEINNIRKDGPGDLGSWFWKSRLCARSEEAMAPLRGFDQGAELEGEERAAVRWLGVRAIARWACGKVLVETPRGGSQTSLWEHCWTLSGLYKSSTAHALIEGVWPQRHRLSWCTLTVVLERPDPETLHLVKGLVEVEYPLGNELRRNDTEIHFTFPGLESELSTSLLDGLRAELGRLAGGNARPQVSLGPCGAVERRDTGEGRA